MVVKKKDEERASTIFFYQSNKHIQDLTYLTRRYSKDDSLKVKLLLSDDIMIETTAARCLVNAKLFRLLDYYKIGDRREEYVFIGSYLKDKPVEYMNHVLHLIETDSYMKSLSDDDFVIQLPHILAEIKEIFYFMAIVVDGILMMDHSLLDYIESYRSVPAFKDIVDGPIILPTDEPWVVDRKLKDLIQKFENELVIPPLTDFYKSGVKVNRSQLMMFFAWGLVPNYLNMDKMLSYPVVGGVLNGYNNRKDIHLNDNVSILALFTQKTEIKAPGRLSKDFAVTLSAGKLNTSDTRETLDDCGTTRYQIITILSKKDLEFFRYKYFKSMDGKFREYIDLDREDLIGRTLAIRSLMSCNGKVICKKCYGANHKFAVDTSVFKVNINDYTLVLIAQILQGVISIKHYLGGILMAMDVTYKGKTESMQSFIKKDFVVSMNYNVVEFSSDTKCELRRIEDKVYLYVNDELLEYDYEITRLTGTNKFRFTIPNDSVMRRANNLTTALNKHDKIGPDGKPDFDLSEYLDLSIDEQMMEIMKYLRGRINLNHFIHYELMVYGMTRDAEDESSRVTESTKKMLFLKAKSISSRPDRNNGISTTLPYGYVKKALGHIYKNIQPNEYDLLYVNLVDKETSSDSLYREMNQIIDDAIEASDEYIANKKGDK